MYYYYAADKTEVYWVHFTGSQVEEYLAHYELPNDKNVFFTGTSPDYQWLYNQMIQELQLHRVNHEELLRILLRHVLLVINRYIKEEQQSGSDVMNEIERAAHYFNENYNKNIIIEQYAEEHLMSKNWFIHLAYKRAIIFQSFFSTNNANTNCTAIFFIRSEKS